MRFSLPFLYYFLTRINTLPKKISWFLVHVVPIIFLCYSFTAINLFYLVPVYFLSLLGMTSIYEIGYLENDVKTTKKEINPTKRLDENIEMYIEKNYNVVLFSKYVFTLIIVIIFWLVNNVTLLELYPLQFLVCLIILRIIYLFHNNLRGKVNIVTFLGLIIFKHYSIILLFLPLSKSLFPLFIIFILLCGQRLIEYASKDRFGLNIKMINKHLFRVLYYFVALLFFSVSKIFTLSNQQEIFSDYILITSFYLFIFRLLISILFKGKNTD
jgi:hypothetical protein